MVITEIFIGVTNLSFQPNVGFALIEERWFDQTYAGRTQLSAQGVAQGRATVVTVYHHNLFRLLRSAPDKFPHLRKSVLNVFAVDVDGKFARHGKVGCNVYFAIMRQTPCSSKSRWDASAPEQRTAVPFRKACHRRNSSSPQKHHNRALPHPRSPLAS